LLWRLWKTGREIGYNQDMIGDIFSFTTPKGLMLDAAWFGPARPKRVFIYIHGLSGNLFHQEIFQELVDRNTAVLAFNNRGSGVIANFRHICRKSAKGYRRETIGAGHEIFTDCFDDIEGAMAATRAHGAKDVFLFGHSTGCQKIAYYLARKPKNAVRGAILVSPISDYATALRGDRRRLSRAVVCARRLVASGKGNSLLPPTVTDYVVDAQRFLSLNTPESREEIFTYASGRQPLILRRAGCPLLVLLGEDDDCADRPVSEIAAWFRGNLPRTDDAVEVLPAVGHSFSKNEKKIANRIKRWQKKIC